jgi:uncharacterized membrane protein
MTAPLALHIASGTVGLLSGGIAISLRKGSRRHRWAGYVFVVSMLSLGVTAAYMAALKSQVGNLFGGIFTVYLVSTAWFTMRPSTRTVRTFSFVALFTVIALGALDFITGILALYRPIGTKSGPNAAYFILAMLMWLAAWGDIRMLRGGLSGKQRLVRHLWRMCFGWFVASGSIFIARPHLFPMVLRKTYVIMFLGFLPLLSMILWVIRVASSRTYRSRTLRSGEHAVAAHASAGD